MYKNIVSINYIVCVNQTINNSQIHNKWNDIHKTLIASTDNTQSTYSPFSKLNKPNFHHIPIYIFCPPNTRRRSQQTRLAEE